MTTKQEQIDKIIANLEMLLEKPRMYFIDSLHCKGFLDGISFTAGTLGIVNHEAYTQIYKEIALQHGWTWKANSTYAEMKEKEYDDDTIINHLLKIEVEIWKKILEVEENQI